MHRGIPVLIVMAMLTGIGRPQENSRGTAAICSGITQSPYSGRGAALLDISMAEIGIDTMRSGHFGTVYTGAGVIIGIYDSGIDWTHPDFITPYGESRIIFIWDQTDATGTPPAGYSYGSEYSADEINNELHRQFSGSVQGLDYWGHGTHVAGIAAGNGRGTGNGQPAERYTGVAPGSDLIVVKGGDTHFIEKQILEGFAYIFSKAESMHRPAVINLSVGGVHKGPHDGSSVFERGVDDLLWDNGRAIVIAAGNEGDDAIHFCGDFSYGIEDTLTFVLTLPGTAPGTEDYAGIDIWYPAWAGLALTLVSPAGTAYGPVSSSCSWSATEGGIAVTVTEFPSASKREMHVWLSDTRTEGVLQDNLAAGEWTFSFRGNPGHFDGWLYSSSMNAYFSEGAVYSSLIAEPGNAPLAITVGSYTSRIEWPSLFSNPFGVPGLIPGAISHFSSPGPTRDGRQKPDITAPGEFILSSFSRWTKINPPTDHYIAQDSVHRAWSGTSMAAPHVTGLVALLFEQNPEYNASEIKSLLLQSARTDIHTGFCPNMNWGFGKLNVTGALYSSGVIAPRIRDGGHHLIVNYPNPFNTNTTLTIVRRSPQIERVTVTIKNLIGEPVITLFDSETSAGSLKINWSGLDAAGMNTPSGVYVAVMQSGKQRAAKKIIKLD